MKILMAIPGNDCFWPDGRMRNSTFMPFEERLQDHELRFYDGHGLIREAISKYRGDQAKICRYIADSLKPVIRDFKPDLFDLFPIDVDVKSFLIINPRHGMPWSRIDADTARSGFSRSVPEKG